MSKLKNILIWLKKNERHLWTVLFVGGFCTDVATFAFTSITVADRLFFIYLVVTIIATIGSHYVYVRGYDQRTGIVSRIINVLFPFVAEFFSGALLSGFLIFYTKGAAILVSWPFILLLFGIFFGNELFRSYKKHLAFQCVLMFFSIYAFAIFALPLAIGKLGKGVFIESGLLSVLAFVIFLVILAFVGWKRLRESAFFIMGGVGAILVLVNVSYFTGLIPPLPLTLVDSGAYLSITHSDTGSNDTYVLTGEAKSPWWDIDKHQEIQITPGSSVYVFSSVFAPISFSSTIVHRWDMYDPAKKTWVQRAEIAFRMSGGRTNGYRGYSDISNAQPGLYRVSIQTLSGQVIGRLYFTISSVSNEPTLTTTYK